MENSDLKTIWQLTVHKQSSIEPLSKEDIRMAIEKKSNSVISKISKRLKLKIWIQMGLGILGLLLVTYLFLAEKESAEITYFFIFSTILALGIHKRTQHRTIVNFQESSYPLRTTLTRVTAIMEKVVKAQIYTVVILATALVLLFLYSTISKEDSIQSAQQFLIIGVAAIIVPFLSYFVAKRGQQKLFGNYIQMLKEYSKELDTSGEEFRTEEENS